MSNESSDTGNHHPSNQPAFRIVLYARLSSSGHAPEQAISRQFAELRKQIAGRHS